MAFRPRLRANPVIVKELRSRMRGVRSFAILTGGLLLLGLISLGLYRIVQASAGYGGPPLSPQIGQVLFTGLILFELMMICFITPALTAGAISGEREMQTYEMLLATPLNPASILRGKLVSALSYIFLLIFAAVPMSSLVFTFGGVSPRDMLKALAILVVVAVTLGVLGIFVSAWLRRTGRATVLTYLLVLTLLIGPYLVYAFAGALRGMQPPTWILIPNPVGALFSALTPTAQGSVSYPGVLGSLGMLLSGRLEPLMGVSGASGWPRPLYHYTLVFYAGLSLVLYPLATRLVRPVRRWRIARREVLGAAALFSLFAAGVAAGFFLTAGRYEWRQDLVGPGRPTPTPAAMRVMAAPPPVVMELKPTLMPQPAVVGPVPTDLPFLSPVPTPTPSAVLPGEDEAAIYAAVVRQLYTVDHTFGDQPPNFPVVYLLQWTDDSVGDPGASQDDPRLLPTAIQEGIAAALADLPAEFRWVAARDEVPLEEPGSRVKDGGAIIAVGNIHEQDDGSVHVSASIYFRNLGAAGKTYVLQRVDGLWRVVGTTGTEWIS
jgi:ABC-2 type transport system permease protein